MITCMLALLCANGTSHRCFNSWSAREFCDRFQVVEEKVLLPLGRSHSVKMIKSNQSLEK